MALLSALFSLVARKLGDLLQAVFGWSITALFGRLPSKKQAAISVALLLSIVWPVFLVGLAFPRAAAWVVAFLPLHHLLSDDVLRVVWTALALLTPAVVGLITHAVAPATKGGPLRAVLNGYPLALGYFSAFFITAVTVPIVKIASLVRGWSDEHVYVQPRTGRYDAVLHDLAEACALAKMVPELDPVPHRMALSTRVLRALSRGAIQPIVPEEPRMLHAEGIELYLYPADLLLRGDPAKVAHVRAMMTRTLVDRDAYLVASEAAQRLQDELGDMWDVIVEHREEHVHVDRSRAASRLKEISDELDALDVPFAEWVMLERITRRLERRLGVEVEEKELVMPTEKNERTAPSAPSNVAKDDESTAALLKEAVDEAKELVRVEVQLAREEVKREVKQARSAAIGFGVAAAFSMLGLTMLAVALVLAIGGTALAALIVAVASFVVTGAAAFFGWSAVPKKPLEDTRRRLTDDVNQMKEHVL